MNISRRRILWTTSWLASFAIHASAAVMVYWTTIPTLSLARTPFELQVGPTTISVSAAGDKAERTPSVVITGTASTVESPRDFAIVPSAIKLEKITTSHIQRTTPVDTAEQIGTESDRVESVVVARSSESNGAVSPDTHDDTFMERSQLAMSLSASTQVLPAGHGGINRGGGNRRGRATFHRNVPPDYPREAQERGWQGRVLVRLRIDATGRVSGAELVKSSGYSILDQAALDAVRQWRAEPARENGRPVATVELQPIIFRIR